jgi:excisionase family DNA binding protein
LNSRETIERSRATAVDSGHQESDVTERLILPDELANPDGLGPDAPAMEPWIGVDDLALALGVSTDWVYEKAAAGELPSYKFGGHRRFRVSEVEDWASQHASGRMAA